MDWTALLTPVVIAVVPILVMFVKKAVAPAPWLLPPLAMVLGAVLEYLTAMAAHKPLSPEVMAIVGLTAVGLRELIDQFKKATA